MATMLKPVTISLATALTGLAATVSVFREGSIFLVAAKTSIAQEPPVNIVMLLQIKEQSIF